MWITHEQVWVKKSITLYFICDPKANQSTKKKKDGDKGCFFQWDNSCN
jgi:hypothetical protein